MKTNSFSLSITVACSAQDLFSALTQTRAIAAWSGQSGKFQPTIGGSMELFDGWVTGVVLAYEPGKRLSFTWKPSDWKKEDRASLVTCRLLSTRSGSKLLLRHSGFPSTNELRSHKDGWKEFVFNPLKAYLTSA